MRQPQSWHVSLPTLISHWLVQSSRNEKIDFQTMAEVAAATQSGKVAGNMVGSYLNRAVINFYDIDLEEETDLKALGLMEKSGYNEKWPC